MRVVVVGGSGNVGTALLSRLARTAAVTSVLAVARRLPERSLFPYSEASWQDLDVGAPDAVPALTELFRAADVVVHLAWALQPSHRPAELERINVGGSRNVADAVVAAGVRHLVYASSIGTYAPAPETDAAVSEAWSASGVDGSSYSAHKAEVERVLDRVEAENPSLVVTRFRPALTFQWAAASSIARYFLGPFAPLRLLRWQRLPLVPFPAGFRFQVVHADDVAAAYVAAILTSSGGPFNLATSPVVTGPDLARLLHGVHLPVPPVVTLGAADLTWRARLQPTEPGWLRLAANAPVMDCTRAERLLGWTATRSSIDTVAELLRGFADHAGMDSPPLRPRPPVWRRLHPAGGSGSW